MWPKQNTAVLITHGIGRHRPFATLDAFVRGFWHVLEKENPGVKIRWTHRLKRHDNWVENYISLQPEGKPSLDFYEYYWDCYMVREVRIKEVLDWVDQVSDGAKRFYDRMPELAQQYESLGVDLFKDGEFEFHGYRRLLLPAMAYFPVLSRLVPLIGSLPRVGAILRPLARLVGKFVIAQLGDLVIYTSSDVRSSNYEIRQKVLSGAVEELKLLLIDRQHERIIVAGHSLGSVIAYDALNRIAQDMSARNGLSPDLAPRIAGLVTFGSPLDKIAFFFQEHTPADNFVQRQILSHFHGYKHLVLPGDADPIAIDDPIRHDLDSSVWLNFFHRSDLVSGSLDAYKGVQNIDCTGGEGMKGAHSSYWTSDQMYREIAGQFF